MKRSFVLAIGMLAAGAASAITANWKWTSNGSDWQASSGIYLVYSESQTLTADQAVKETGFNYGANSDAKNSVGGAWVTPSEDYDTRTSGSSSFPNSGKLNNVSFPATATWDGVGNGYYYLVIFNSTVAEDATEFAVAQAGTSGYLKVNEGGQVVAPGPDGTLIPIEYIDPNWIGGTYHRAAPEPTALALLALGVAGAALRRRVR